MDTFVVRPGGPLLGTEGVGGAKNSARKLMAACLLAEDRYTLSNVPRITDVETMSDVLAAMGVGVQRTGAHELTMDTPGSLTPEARQKAERGRRSLLVQRVSARRRWPCRAPS
jgi:UDP-N-acetylglucosamine 1-carboxyvinyltransferase